MRLSRLFICLSLLAASLVLVAPQLAAETIRLRAGSTLDVDHVEFQDEHVRVRARIDGGTAVLSLPFERIEPASLLALIAGHFDANDVAAQLRAAAILGRAATAGPLRQDAAALEAAAERYERVLLLDESKGAEVVAAVQALAARHSARHLAPIEEAIREGKGAAAVEAIVELHDSPLLDYFDAAGRLKLGVLEQLAQKLASSQLAPVAVDDEMDHGDRSRLRRAHRELAHASEDRNAAIKATQSDRRARSALLRAERHLHKAHRLIGQITSGAAARIEQERDLVNGLLLRNALDLAAMYRDARRPDDALRRIRTALLIDPDNAEALALKKAIEAEQTPTPEVEPPESELLLDSLYTPYYYRGRSYLSPYSIYPYGYPYSYPYRSPYGTGTRRVIRRGGVGFWLRGNYGAGTRGSYRGIGRRR